MYTLDADQVEERVMKVLRMHVGQANACGRWDLVAEVFGHGSDQPRSDSNKCDRAVRKAIERLRNGGTLICNLGDGSGWFLPSSEEEYKAFRAAYGSHAFPILENIRAMDATARQRWPNLQQPRLM
jgi:hypothetical protein